MVGQDRDSDQTDVDQMQSLISIMKRASREVEEDRNFTVPVSVGQLALLWECLQGLSIGVGAAYLYRIANINRGDGRLEKVANEVLDELLQEPAVNQLLIEFEILPNATDRLAEARSLVLTRRALLENWKRKEEMRLAEEQARAD